MHRKPYVFSRGDEDRTVGSEASAELRGPSCQRFRRSGKKQTTEERIENLRPSCGTRPSFTECAMPTQHSGVPSSSTALCSPSLLATGQGMAGLCALFVAVLQAVCNCVACHCLSSRNFHKKLLPRLAEKIHVFTTEDGQGVSDLRSCGTQAAPGSAGSPGGCGWLGPRA